MPNGTAASNGLENGLEPDDERAEADQRRTYAEAAAAKEEGEEGGERPTTTRQQPKKSARRGERPAPMKAEHPGRVSGTSTSRHYFVKYPYGDSGFHATKL